MKRKDKDSYLNKMKDIQEKLLEFFNKIPYNDQDFKEVLTYITKLKICKNKNELKSFLYLISKITKNHHRIQDIIEKAEKIINNFVNKITENFTNIEIFNIFKSNKRILLYLFESKILIPDETIFFIISKYKYKKKSYLEYFNPEFKTFIEKYPNSIFIDNTNFAHFINEIDHKFEFNYLDIENFEEKRKIGENDSKICELIRNDSINDFIKYVGTSNIDVKKATIEPSIFETNSKFIKNDKYASFYSQEATLIQYAAFFGSIQIFKYLMKNGAKVSRSLLDYAVHSENSEIIHMLEECQNDRRRSNEEISCEILKESIKCHHNQLFDEPIEITDLCLKYYNFELIEKEKINNDNLYQLIANDYFILVNYLLKNENIDINDTIISKIILF